MKFGATIKSSLYSEWQSYYIDYSGLKKDIKRTLNSSGVWNRTNEDNFLSRLQIELEKVSRFQEDKVDELTQQIAYYEEIVKDLVESRPTTPQIGSDEDGDGDGDDDTNVPDDTNTETSEIEDRFLQLEEELENLIADVHDLARFTHLNYTGFIKIVKKHDKQTGWQLRGEFMRKYLEKRPFFKENYDSLIVQLSKIYNLVRTRGHPVTGDSSAGGNQSAFVRQTTKYWVHPDNYIDLKLAILRHLPVLVFDPEKKFEPSDSAISSIYFDNPDLDLYLGRLEKTDGAQAIRLRWYGPEDNKQIFVERKTHREDWTGEKSVKARFPIKEDQVNDYLAGTLDMTSTFEKLRGKKSDKEVDNMIKLAREVQEAVQKRDLHPCVRTFYQRTAFQLPGDARVRISFDTNLALVREDDWDGKNRCNGNWRRTDIGIDWPFDQLSEDDKYLFPYGVLEVKLQTQYGQEPPEWVKDLVNSHLVEAVPKFSKFLTGCAQLLPHRVTLLPFWIPQMDCDIRKQPSENIKAAKTVTIARPSKTSLNGHGHGSNAGSAPGSGRASTVDTADSPKIAIDEYGETEPVSEDEDGGDGDGEASGGSTSVSRSPSVAAKKSPSKDKDSSNDEDEDEVKQAIRVGAPKKVAVDEASPLGLPEDAMTAVREAREHREREIALSKSQMDRHDDDNDLLNVSPKQQQKKKKKSTKTGQIFAKLTPTLLQRVLHDKYFGYEPVYGDEEAQHSRDMGEGEENPHDNNNPDQRIEFVSHFKAQSGKLIAVPVRVEPKVYMANERTFLAWLEFSVIISAIGITLLNFTDVDDPVGIVAGSLFTAVALLAIAYSGGVFYWRAFNIRKRMAVAYDDRYGPSLLCVAILAAVSTNFIMRITE